MTSPGFRGVVNDAVAVDFLDATAAAGFVARWCAGKGREGRGRLAPRVHGVPSQRQQAGARGPAGASRLRHSRSDRDSSLRRRGGRPSRSAERRAR